MNKKPLKIFLRILTAAALLICAVPNVCAEESPEPSDSPEIVEGETISDGTLTYTKSRKRGCVYVTSCQANLSDIIIPNEIDGYKVLGIYDGAFAGVSSLTSVKLTEGIEYIGQAAFYECEKLTEIIIPKSIKKIPDNCFCYCKNLRNTNLPETVDSIGSYSFAFSGIESLYIGDRMDNISILAFVGCKNLKEINVSENNTKYTAVDDILYSKDMTALELFPGGKKMLYFDIPESVAYIQPGAFHDSPLEQITMTNNVKWIGATAFSASKNLKNVVLSDSITQISIGAFSDCTSLKSIDIPASVTQISEYAFYGCNYLKNIDIPDSVNDIGEKALGLTDDGNGNERKISDFKIKARYDSAAGKYARENKISIDYTDGNPYTPFIIIGIAAGIAIIAVVIIIIKKKISDPDNDNDDDYSEDDENDNDDDDKDDAEDENEDNDNDENDEYYTGNDIEA